MSVLKTTPFNFMRNFYSILISKLAAKLGLYPLVLALVPFLYTCTTSAIKYYLRSVGKRLKCRNQLYYLLKFQPFKPINSLEYFPTQASLQFTFGLSLQTIYSH